MEHQRVKLTHKLGKSGHVNLFTRPYAYGVLKNIRKVPPVTRNLSRDTPTPYIPHYLSFPKRIK